MRLGRRYKRVKYKSRKGKISFRFRGRRRYIKPYIRIKRRWCRIRRRRGRVTVKLRGRYRRFKLIRGIPAFRKGRKWRRIRYRTRISRRRRRQRKRKYRRNLRRLRRLRRYRRRMRRRRRRIRRSRRRNSSFMIYYHRKRRVVFRWKGRLTFRLGGRRRRIRLSRGQLYYYFRRAWRHVPMKKYRLYVYSRRRWRPILIRRGKLNVRFGRRYIPIRVTTKGTSINLKGRWVPLKRRRRARPRKRPWRRGRRYGQRRPSVMRLYLGRRWRSVYQSRGKFFFRYRRKTCSLRFVRGSVSYFFGRRWYRISPVSKLRIRVKGRFRRVRIVRKNIYVTYRRKRTPIRIIYGKIRFYSKRKWRRISTLRGRRTRRRQRLRKLRRYWRRFRRRRRMRRHRYRKRNGRIFFRWGRKFNLVRSKKGRLRFRIGTKYYFLRIRDKRGIWIRSGRKPWSLIRRPIRRLKMYVRGKLRWIYPRKGRLMVYYKRRGRPIRFRNGRPFVWLHRRWKGLRVRSNYAKMRIRIGGVLRIIHRVKGQWTVHYQGKSRKIKLRGRRFGIRVGGKWKYIPARGGALQIRYGRMWRRVRNCCNKLKAVLRGRLRRIRLRYGKAKMRGKKGWSRLLRKGFGKFRLKRLRDQPVAQTTIQEGDQPQGSDTIDPSPATNKSPGSQVFDSPPTAADREVPPQSITDEISRETGSTMNVNDYL